MDAMGDMATADGSDGPEGGGAKRREPGVRRIVLVGNPNVGKSALFNALTGLRATVSNYPGTTVEVYRGRLAGTAPRSIDSPGLNSLLPLSEDEQVTWDLVRSVRGEEGAVVVQVADAKNLRRRPAHHPAARRSSRCRPSSSSTCTTRPRRAASGSTSAGSRRRWASRCARPWPPAASGSRG